MNEEPDFLDGEQGIVHDGLPDLSKYLFIHSSLDDAGLDPYEFRVFCHLRRRAKDRKAWPGMRSISEITGMSLGKVCQSIKSLSDKGFIAVRKRENASNIYLIQSPKERSPDEHPVHSLNGGVPVVNERVSIEGTPLISNKALSASSKPKRFSLDDAKALELPESLRTQEFLDAWNNLWLPHRFSHHSGKPSLMTITQTIRRCKEWGPDKAIRFIEQAVAAGWQGIFNTEKKFTKPSEPDRDILGRRLN